MPRNVDAGVPLWRRLPPVKLARRYLRRDARLAYLRSRLRVGSEPSRIIRCVVRLTDARPGDLEPYLAELPGSDILGHLADAEARFAAEVPTLALGSLNRAPASVLYALVRLLKPRIVVETGTANGVSTLFLLAALDRNGRGRLISIDLPFACRDGVLVPLAAGGDIEPYSASPLPPGRQPGWIVPARLRGRWELRLGNARDLLPVVLGEAGEIELFLHDSLHLRDHMRFELEAAWRHLAPGGVLAADDVFQRRHDAFPSFARSVGVRYLTLDDTGFIRKPRHA